MAYQRVPNTAEIRVVHTIDGVDCVNTYHAEAPGGYNQAMLDTLAAQIDITPAPGLMADLSNYCFYVRTDVRGLDQENDLAATANANATAGSKSTRPMPPNVAFCVQRLSGKTGRSARGRVYIAGLPIDFAYFQSPTTTKLTTAAGAAYVAHVDAFRATIEAIGPWDAVIVSRYANGAKRAEAVTFPWLQTAYSDLKVDTRRGRLS